MSHNEKMPLSKIWIICRVCLQQQEKLFHLYDEIFNKNIWLYLRDCGGVPVRKNDDFPDKICEECLRRLKKAINFRIDCQRSHSKLVQMRINRDATMHKRDSEEEIKAISLVEFQPQIFAHYEENHKNLVTSTSDNKSIECENNDRSNKERCVIKGNDKKENNLEKNNKLHGRKPIVMLLKLKQIPLVTSGIETNETEATKVACKLKTKKQTVTKESHEVDAKINTYNELQYQRRIKTKLADIAESKFKQNFKRENGQFPCRICKKIYNTYNLLRHHKYIHNKSY